MPLRVIYRRALEDGDVAISPCTQLRLPAVRGRRERIAAPDEAARLLTALPLSERAFWALALYAGLRRGELMALRWSDVDLKEGVLRVERAWDVKGGIDLEPKSRSGRRKVPIARVLRDILVDHRKRSPGIVVLARPDGRPVNPRTSVARAAKAWEMSGLAPLTLHEARHTFASLMIAAGVNARALCSYMGHSSVTITYDRYGHLMPGNEDEAAALLDAYLERARAGGQAST
jgi:integrase